MKKASLLFVMTTSVFLSSQLFGWWMYTPGDAVDNPMGMLFVQGYEPDQPIPFSHKLHAGDRKIDCQYCHSAARRSITAGIPPMNTCMGCHTQVKTDSPHIQKLTELYKKNEPMKWVKVHDLPDYVRFSHQVHVNAKGPDGKNMLECQTCHGEVQKMEKVGQWAPLQMGWCIGCHTETKIPAKDGHPAVQNAPVSCNTCHY